MHIRDLIEGIEFETITTEFKRKLSHEKIESWCKTVVAFANTKGGSLFVGVNDDGIITGIKSKDLDDEIRFFNQKCATKIQPKIDYEYCRKLVKDDLYVLEIKVRRSSELPVWFICTDKNNNQIVYIRREGESVQATIEEIKKMAILSVKRKPYDEIVTNIKYDESKFTKLNQVYKEKNDRNEDITKKILQSKGAVTLEGDYLTNTGLLFADDCPIMDCNIKCRLWPGFSKGLDEVTDHAEFQGNALEVLEFGQYFIRKNGKHGYIKQSSGRIDKVSYPDKAVEEALVNAIVHRDYYITGGQIDVDIFVDRLKIVSPGDFLLKGEAQNYNMKEISSLRRNVHICEIFALCKLMERAGSGLPKIKEAYSNYGDNYQPSVRSTPDAFTITLKDLTYEEKTEGIFTNNMSMGRKISYASLKNGNRKYDEKILSFCLDVPKSRKEIQDYIEAKNPGYFMGNILKPLVDKEFLLRTQTKINAPNQKYYTNKKLVKIIDQG